MFISKTNTVFNQLIATAHIIAAPWDSSRSIIVIRAALDTDASVDNTHLKGQRSPGNM